MVAALAASVPLAFGINRTVDRYVDNNSMAETETEHAGRIDPIIYNQAKRRYDEFLDDFETGTEFNREIYPKKFPPDDIDIKEMKELVQRHRDRSGDTPINDTSYLEIMLIDFSYLFCGPCGRNNKTAEDEMRSMAETLRANGYNFCLERDLVLPSISFDYDSAKLMGYSAVSADGGKSRRMSYKVLKEVMKNNNSVPQTIVYVNGVPVANHVGPLKKLDIVECIRNVTQK